MAPDDRTRRWVSIKVLWCAIVCGTAVAATFYTARPARASCPCGKTWPHLRCHAHHPSHAVGPGDIVNADMGGAWYWVRSPEQERRVVMNLFNRYCIRCHGVDGRGVWDIPDVPDFANSVWQATRSDDYRARVILEGRGAVMPAFRGTLTLEEASAMARYLHTFLPGNEVSRPGLGPAEPAPSVVRPPVSSPPPAPTPAPARTPSPAPAPAPAPGTPGPFGR